MRNHEPSSDEVITANGLKLTALVQRRWAWTVLLSCMTVGGSVMGYLGKVAYADRQKILTSVETVAAKVDVLTTRQAESEFDRGETARNLIIIQDSLRNMDKKIDRHHDENANTTKEILELLIKRP